MIYIEKGIPFPVKVSKWQHPFDEIPWDKMQVGDSFRIVARSSGGLKVRAKRHGYEIAIKAEMDGMKAAAFRVWRTK